MRHFIIDRIGKNEEVERVESLERYFSVMENKVSAKFQICKKIPISVDLSSDEDLLWKFHDKALDEFEDLLEKVDKKKTDITNLDTPERSLLDLKVELANRILESCHFCERKCGINRRKGETGVCGVGEVPKVSSEFIHIGEESELVPSYTIFFSGCTFKCQFCQNWNISQNPDSGVEYYTEKIASLISDKRKGGAKNVNWVGGDPTPNLHHILASLKKTKVNIPSVWNSNMYLSEESMKLLSGTQDVYLTDFKYGNNECASKYSKVKNYWEVVTRNHKLAFDDAELIIRHLVLPEHLECCTKNIFKWIGSELGKNVRVNIMGQYRPEAKARKFSELSRRVSADIMEQAFKIADEIGLKNTIR